MIRTGDEYRESIRDGREVWIDGHRVDDVTTHPAFKPIVDVRARIYDMAHDPDTREVMTYEEDGERHAVGLKPPRTRQDWHAKRRAASTVVRCRRSPGSPEPMRCHANYVLDRRCAGQNRFIPEEIVIPAREGRSARVAAGQSFRVTDREGGQVGDLFAFSAAEPSEYASAEHTRAYVSRLFPRVGEPFVTNRRRPILVLERDESPGVHDMLCAACDPERYAGLGVEGWHASCEENLRTAMRELGHDRIEVPQPINLFMNIPVAADGTLGWEPAPTRAGDGVVLRAEMDCIVVVSACPQDIVPINGGNPTSLAIELL